MDLITCNNVMKIHRVNGISNILKVQKSNNISRCHDNKVDESATGYSTTFL